MAEGFARAHGTDILEASSAGLAPASYISPLTKEVMQKFGIDVSDAWPKSIEEAPGGPFDLIVNMSGYPLPEEIRTSCIEWDVLDPISFGEDVYTHVAEQLEALVKQLILDLRMEALTNEARSLTAQPPPPLPRGPGGSRMYRRNRP
jgi:protein-tyrosine-phosphatase